MATVDEGPHCRGLTVKVDTLVSYGGSWDCLITINVKRGCYTAQFQFLLNCGATFDLQSQTLTHIDRHHPAARLDGVLLSGSRIEHIGGLPSLASALSSTDVPLFATDPTFKFAKLNLYDRIITLETRRYVLIDENDKDTATFSDASQRCRITLDQVDDVLGRVQRVRYCELVRIAKPWVVSSQPTLFQERLENCILELQAIPSGTHLGSCIWIIASEGEYASALIGHSFTTKPNWFFDGLDLDTIVKPPSILVTACPFLPPPTAPLSEFNAAGPSAKAFSQLPTIRIPHLPTVTSSAAANRILTLTKQILRNGGSVLIPVSLGLDALKLLILFQSAWISSWKAYPIFFVSPTGSLLLEFSKTMLDWASARFRERFCVTRVNPFDNFSSIQCITSAADIAAPRETPCVIIATPGQLHSGGIISLAAWLTICEDPRSAVLFVTPPSAEDLRITEPEQRLSVKQIKSKHLPADDLYRIYLEERPTRGLALDITPDGSQKTTTPALETPAEEPQDAQDKEDPASTTSQGSDELSEGDGEEEQDAEEPTKDDVSILSELFCYRSTDRFKLSSALTSNAPKDQYGVQLTPDADDWADLRFPTCVHSQDEPCSDLLLAASRKVNVPDHATVEDVHKSGHHLSQRLRIPQGGGPERNGDSDGRTDVLPNEPCASNEDAAEIPQWRKQLRVWYHGEDPLGEAIESYSRHIRALRHVVLGLFDDGAAELACDAQSFAEWISPVIALQPRNVVLLPTQFNERLLHSLIETALRQHFPQPPHISICETPTETVSIPSDVKSELVVPKAVAPAAVASVEWSELVVNLNDPGFVGLLQDFQSLVLLQKQNRLPLQTPCRYQSLIAFREKHSDNAAPKDLVVLGRPHWNPLLCAAYVPLNVDECSTALPAPAAVSVKKNEEDESDSTMQFQMHNRRLTLRLASRQPSDAVVPSTALLDDHITTIDNDDLSASTPRTHTAAANRHCSFNQPPLNPQWISVGQIPQHRLLQRLARDFPSDSITTASNVINVQDRASVTFQQPSSGHQVVHLHGGLDLTTLLLKQHLRQAVAETGSLFSR